MGKHRLTYLDAEVIRNRYINEGESIAQLAYIYKKSQLAIKRVITNQTLVDLDYQPPQLKRIPFDIDYAVELRSKNVELKEICELENIKSGRAEKDKYTIAVASLRLLQHSKAQQEHNQ